MKFHLNYLVGSVFKQNMIKFKKIYKTKGQNKQTKKEIQLIILVSNWIIIIIFKFKK